MPLVTFRRIDHLGEIVIDRPPQNLFNSDLLTDLRSAVDAAASSDVRAVLVRAEGDDFSAGADVDVFIGIDDSQAAELEATVIALIGAIEGLPVPTLALIHGQCYAGALEVCLACDLIWAAEGSQIGQIEAVAGGIPYAGGTQRLASRIGAGRAAEMVFTAAILPPETLASWGVINQVTPAPSLVEQGRSFAQSLANGPTRAHTTTKRVLQAWRSGGVAAAELAEIARRVEEAEDLGVVVFASEHPDFFMARYDLSDTNSVAFAPTESGVTLFIDSMLRLNEAGPITIACIRGRARGGGSEFALSCDLRFASAENTLLGQPEVGVGIVPDQAGQAGDLEGLPGSLTVSTGRIRTSSTRTSSNSSSGSSPPTAPGQLAVHLGRAKRDTSQVRDWARTHMSSHAVRRATRPRDRLIGRGLALLRRQSARGERFAV